MSGGAEEKPSVQEEQDTPPQTTEAAAASWDKYADEWDGMAGAESFWGQDTAKEIDSLLPGGPAGLGGKSILEFGCGTGVIGLGLVQRAAKEGAVCKVTLADIAPKMVENAKKKAGELPKEIQERVNTVAGDVLEEGGLAPGPYDVVMSGSVLTFLPDARDGLHKLRKRMNAGGQMIHFVWRRPEDKQRREDKHHFWDGFTVEELKAAMEEEEAGGLEKVEVREFKFRMGEGEDQTMGMLIGTGFVKRG